MPILRNKKLLWHFSAEEVAGHASSGFRDLGVEGLGFEP